MATCGGCGKRIVWGEDQHGTMIPLDPSAPVYRVVKQGSGGEFKVRLLEMEDGVREAMVSHFKTCPDADQFSRRK